jgi:arylsulfatase A-like enzyme
MNRRKVLQTLAAGAAAPAVWPQGKRKPNVIGVLLDDLGCTDLGCYGAEDMKTRNVDELAASGTKFTNWYSNAPVCAPARGSLMTGRYPARAGVPTNGAALGEEQQTVAALLKTQNYRTALIGKWHLGSRNFATPNNRGFDYFYGFHPGCVDFYSHRFYWGDPKVPNYHDLFRNRTEIFEDGQYLTDRLNEEAVQFVRQNAREPFFLYLAYNAPHYPMHAPKKYLDRFPGMDFERRVYAAMVSAVDDGIGMVREELRRQGLLDDTCIFFIGDNGATTEPRAGLDGKPATAGQNGPYRGYKFSLFDGGMHVPGIMSWPGEIPAGKTVNEVVMSMDVLPTIITAAGMRAPSGHIIDGRDILPVVSGGAKSPHDAIFWMQNDQLAVRRGKWKLVIDGFTAERWPEGRTPLQGEDAIFLSDLDADPGESRNLRRANPRLVDELATLAQKWKAEMQALIAK